MNKTRKLALIALGAALCAGLLALSVGCSSGRGHQIVNNEPCMACHSDDRDSAPAAVTVSGMAVSPNVVVTTNAEEVVVCQPTFSTSDDEYVIPNEYSRISVKDGSAQLNLEAGMWAICIDHGGYADITLVEVDPELDGTELNM